MNNEEPEMPEWVQELTKRQEEFENITYPNMTWEEKVNFWVSDIYQMMRSSGENSADEYQGFRPKSYLQWKKVEPRIDEILGILKYRLHLFDEAEMWRRIHG